MSRKSRNVSWAFVAVTTTLLLGCSGFDGGASGRLVAVHNALQAMGFSQVGEISDGTLAQGRSTQLTYALEEGECYVFVAQGEPGVADVNLEIVSPQGEQLGADQTTDRQSVLQVCAAEAGEHTLRLTMAGGSGRFLIAQWSGGTGGSGGGGGLIAASGGAEGSCSRPIEVELGSTVSGNTAMATDLGQGTCVPGNAPELAYRLTLDSPSHVCIDMTSTYDGALILQRECGQSHTELACNDDSGDTTHSQLSETLEQGTYYVLASGYQGGSGSFSLTTAAADGGSPATTCAQATRIIPGQTTSGTTAGCVPDAFQATCAAGARSPEKVYRLDVQKRSRVRIEASTTSYDGALYVRRNCTDPSSEVACNDDYMDTHHSLVTATMDPGTYYVFADGYAERNQGAFTLQAQMAQLSGAAVPGDACASAQPLTPGHITGTTMVANADLTGTCASSPDAPDLVYQLQLAENSRVRARMTRSDMRAALYIQSTCGDRSSEVTCETSGSLEQVLQAGTYYLVVDGLDPNAFGQFEMDVETTSTRQIEAQCRQAPILRPQSPVSASTSGSDEFHASCAGGARSPEAIYRLRLPRRRRVRLSLDSSYDGAIYIRRTCLDESTELACNDDHMDTRHSLIETTLDRGTYYVFVDGFSSGNQGTYTLRVELENPR